MLNLSGIKALILFVIIFSSGADVFAITEIWLTERDQAQRAKFTLPGFKLLDHSIKGRSGGELHCYIMTMSMRVILISVRSRHLNSLKGFFNLILLD